MKFSGKYIVKFKIISFIIVLMISHFDEALFSQVQENQLFSPDNQLNINNASYEEIIKLPIPIELSEQIYDRITHQGPLKSIYELNSIEGMTREIFFKIKPLIEVEPYLPKTEREERIDNLYYKIERWEGNEGVNHALVDLWIEQILDPIHINTIRYDQLQNLQGVSPVDAAAIIKYRNRVGKIFSQRDLRSAPHLSYYGFRNTRDFVAFEPVIKKQEFHGHFTVRMDDTPFLTEEAEATALIPAEKIDNNYPNIYTRFIGSYGQDLHFGFSYFHSLYEPVIREDVGFFSIPSPKFYAGIENKKLGPIILRKLYLGNYSIAFGQGVVMENTDFFLPRKHGLGFRKRFIGLFGDNSRTRQYKLSGAASELAIGNAHVFLFGSYDKRDAILNVNPVLINGELHYPMNQLIVLDQRFKYAPSDTIFRRNLNDLPWRDNVNELLLGTHLSYDFFPASQVGVTYYESAYDRLIRPEVTEIIEPENDGLIALPDLEILKSYGGSVSDGENPFWDEAKSFRRVYGIDFQMVFENVVFQGEYAELDKDRGIFNNPHAFVTNAYIQYNNFYLMGLYRDYHLEFDNPYQRSFSNYRRYKRTIFEDYFYLQDPQYGQLYTNNPQPQNERGFYLLSRYQVNRNFLVRLEYDKWRRVSDDATQHRLVGTVEFRPVFPVRINLRQKYQGREVENNLTTEYFENFEFRGTLRLRLSRYDELGGLYVSALTKFRPRPRFLFPIQTGEELQDDNLAGNIGSPAEALGGFYTHNFNEWLKIKGFFGYYKGFFWTFEDTQFMVMDSPRGAMRFWISMYSRINPKISMRIKYTRDYNRATTFLQTRDSNNNPIIYKDGNYYQTDYRQNRQDFYYLELNVHF